MTHHHCVQCGDAIANGEGHIRSENFRQIAWCDLCWLLDQLGRGPVTIPQQRTHGTALSRQRLVGPL
jgi:hypothetical protein